MPRPSGAYNQRYLSPTFKSNNILYGEQATREAADFYTEKAITFSSPRTGKRFDSSEKLASTNAMAPYANCFGKGNQFDINQKNYSSVPLGGIENHYKLKE